MIKHSLVKFGIIIVLLGSCRAYRQNILFKTNATTPPSGLSNEKALIEKNYKIQINDKLSIRVYTNEGERIIDPDYELVQKTTNQNLIHEEREYLVQYDGMMKIPMVGMVHMEGFTIREAEEVLQDLFSKFYKNPFVILQFTNKRVIVLGAPGGQVIPLKNEDMSLIEVLALAGGINNNAKGYNVRLIRGDLKNPEVEVIDLSTIEGMKKASLKVYSGDIIYIEPVRKIVTESIADITPVLSLVIGLISAVTLLILIQK
jgi:polysaccharide export outer membrane protein